jgi:hypothetical protein
MKFTTDTIKVKEHGHVVYLNVRKNKEYNKHDIKKEINQIIRLIENY